jgi:SM-20-related protein
LTENSFIFAGFFSVPAALQVRFMQKTQTGAGGWEESLSGQIYEAITEGIADHGYAVADHFLTDIETEALRQQLITLKDQGALRQAAIGAASEKHIRTGIRGDKIAWIEREEARPLTQLFLNRIDGLMEYLNRALFLGLKDYETHFTAYPPGSFYKRHLDQSRAEAHRRISFICYLNSGWEESNGGQLLMYLPDGKGGETEVKIPPVGGRLVCFRSDLLEHEVLKTLQTRYSITGWMLDCESGLRFL